MITTHSEQPGQCQQQIDDGSRIGAVAGNISQADKSFRVFLPCPLATGLQRLQVAVNIRNDGNLHDETVYLQLGAGVDTLPFDSSMLAVPVRHGKDLSRKMAYNPDLVFHWNNNCLTIPCSYRT